MKRSIQHIPGEHSSQYCPKDRVKEAFDLQAPAKDSFKQLKSHVTNGKARHKIQQVTIFNFFINSKCVSQTI